MLEASAPHVLPDIGDEEDANARGSWHGTVNGYSNHKYRCAECRAANTRYTLEYREKRFRGNSVLSRGVIAWRLATRATDFVSITMNADAAPRNLTKGPLCRYRLLSRSPQMLGR